MNWFKRNKLSAVQLNPLFFDMETPEGRAEYEAEKKELERSSLELNQIKEISREPHNEPFVLKCWRGCTPESLEMMTVQRGPGFRILGAKRSRSGAIWFSHQFQLEGQDYAVDHGGIQITYPLQCSSYYDIVKYSNGESVKEPNKEMSEKVEVYKECPFGIFGRMVLGLPSGWSFSEHGEKHVICETQVMIKDDMIRRI